MRVIIIIIIIIMIIIITIITTTIIIIMRGIIIIIMRVIYYASFNIVWHHHQHHHLKDHCSHLHPSNHHNHYQASICRLNSRAGCSCTHGRVVPHPGMPWTMTRGTKCKRERTSLTWKRMRTTTRRCWQISCGTKGKWETVEIWASSSWCCCWCRHRSGTFHGFDATMMMVIMMIVDGGDNAWWWQTTKQINSLLHC